MNDAEEKFSELVKRFEAETKNIVMTAIHSIHSDMVPYLNSDTDANALYRAQSIVSKILSGNYEMDEGGHIVVDGWTITALDTVSHDELIDKLAEKCADKAMQLKVERLERQLAEAYKTY